MNMKQVPKRDSKKFSKHVSNLVEHSLWRPSVSAKKRLESEISTLWTTSKSVEIFGIKELFPFKPSDKFAEVSESTFVLQMNRVGANGKLVLISMQFDRNSDDHYILFTMKM